MEKWIISRLSSAITHCNAGFENYDFPKVTTAIYNFWLYELCDVFLVSLQIQFINKVILFFLCL